ncbi:hypothetical protein QTP86_029613, partial [Hemibagrus guttatus]
SAQVRDPLDNLTRSHGVRVVTVAGVEECCLAAGEVVRHRNVLVASRMNSAVVLFVNTVENAVLLTQKGIVLRGSLTDVLSLSTPAKKVTLSNVPPFISNETLERQLSIFGKLISPIKKMNIGSKSDLAKHVHSFRRFTYMILNNNSTELQRTLTFKIHGFDYVIYVSTESMRCFGCRKTGHLVRACPQRAGSETPPSDESDGSVRGSNGPDQTAQQDRVVEADSPVTDGENASKVDSITAEKPETPEPTVAENTETDPVPSDGVSNTVELRIQEEQCCFQPSCGTLDQLYTLHRVLEGSFEFAQPVHMCFMDLEKAFDRVPRGILWEVLWEYGVRGPLLRAVRSLYNQSRSLVRIASCKSDLFPVHVGLRQGCLLSPFLFIVFMDRISRNSQGLEGVWFGDHRISSLIFADDVVLLAPSSLDLQHALGCFAAECEAAGMRVSTSKSEAMVLDRKKVACTLQVVGEVLPQVEEFKYLGVLFTSEGSMDREIDRRIGAAAAVMQSMYRSVVVKKELSRKAKLSIYQSIYVPTLTYGHELWVMTERVRSRIQVAEMSFLRRVAGSSLRDRVRSSVTQEGLGVEPLLLHIERGQLRWLRHLFWMPPGRLPGEVFRACPTGKRPRGKPRTRWRDYVSQLAWECLGVPPEELEKVSGEREIWRLFKVQRATTTDSLHWLLQEPLVYGARLDVRDSSLSQSLLTSGVTTLKHLVDVAGPHIKNVDRVAAQLGVRSERVVSQLLRKWTLIISCEEREMLTDYCSETESPDPEDPFPELALSVDCGQES